MRELTKRKAVCLTLTVAMLSGCANLSGSVNQLENYAAGGSMHFICKGMTIDKWQEIFGNAPDRAAAWRTICQSQLVQIPAAQSMAIGPAK